MSSVINISVNKSSPGAQRNKKIVSYEIETVINKKQHICVSKRYTDFAQEYRLWWKILDKADREKFPLMPRKDLFTSKFDEVLIEERRKQFEDILRTGSHFPKLLGSEYFQHFVGVKGHLPKDIIVAHFREVREKQSEKAGEKEEIEIETAPTTEKEKEAETMIPPARLTTRASFTEFEVLQKNQSAQVMVLREKEILFRKLLKDCEAEISKLSDQKEKNLATIQELTKKNTQLSELEVKNEKLKHVEEELKKSHEVISNLKTEKENNLATITELTSKNLQLGVLELKNKELGQRVEELEKKEELLKESEEKNSKLKSEREKNLASITMKNETLNALGVKNKELEGRVEELKSKEELLKDSEEKILKLMKEKKENLDTIQTNTVLLNAMEVKNKELEHMVEELKMKGKEKIGNPK